MSTEGTDNKKRSNQENAVFQIKRNRTFTRWRIMGRIMVDG
jgi:hypothetical protein